jgi:hypothetical protein
VSGLPFSVEARGFAFGSILAGRRQERRFVSFTAGISHEGDRNPRIRAQITLSTVRTTSGTTALTTSGKTTQATEYAINSAGTTSNSHVFVGKFVK